LLTHEDIKRRWYQTFSLLLNESRGPEEVGGQTPNILNHHEYRTINDIATYEVWKAIKDMGKGKVVRPDNIPIEVWKCLRE
jgi:hypothetical protein